MTRRQGAVADLRPTTTVAKHDFDVHLGDCAGGLPVVVRGQLLPHGHERAATGGRFWERPSRGMDDRIIPRHRLSCAVSYPVSSCTSSSNAMRCLPAPTPLSFVIRTNTLFRDMSSASGYGRAIWHCAGHEDSDDQRPTRTETFRSKQSDQGFTTLAADEHLGLEPCERAGVWHRQQHQQKVARRENQPGS